MRRETRRILIRGVLLFSAVTVFCLTYHLKSIPIKLESSCRVTLGAFDVRKYGVLAEGRDVQIHGIVPDAGRIDSLKDRLSGIPGIRRLTLEFRAGIDSVRIERIRRLAGRHVFFGLDSAIPHPSSEGLLDSVASVLKSYPGIHLTLRGWTDKRGDPAYNLRLSDRRAEAVREVLIEKGCDPARISVRGLGPYRPDSFIETDSLAHRVEFLFEEKLP
ncbi:MAG TPA: OmpA family protein [bacterium]|nr:OmpA family protein [bacterium]